MGQKVHPHGLRVGVIEDWSSKWYADKKDYAKFVVEDNKIRKVLKKELYQARVSEIVIERTKNDINIIIYTAKPGLVIGKNGAQLETIKAMLKKKLGIEANINVIEIKRPDLNSQVVAENIAGQLERRVSFRKAMKQAMQRTMRAGAKGIKVSVSGRLGGADMARTEGYAEGTVPQQTIRANIDYGFAEADTMYGKLGVKVLIYKGEVLGNKKERLTDTRERNNYGSNNKNNKRNNKNNRNFKNKKNNNTPRRNKNEGKGEKEVTDNAINAKKN